MEHYRDDSIVSTHAVGGSVLYFERWVIERIGGMETDLGKYGREHVNLSDRIFSAGLTTWRYQDVPEATDGRLFYECDRHEKEKTQSTATREDVAWDRGYGRQQWIDRRHETKFVPYRESRRGILTDLYTKSIDPQRGRVTGLTAASVDALIKSVDAPLVIFTDIDNPPVRDGVTWIPSKAAIRVDFQRWVNVARYLGEHRDIDWVWHVDATDVTMTKSPWSAMREGILYTGDEPLVLCNEWMLKTHPDSTLQQFMKTNPDLQLLNAGILGGERRLVLEFARRMVAMYCDDQIDDVQKWETGKLGTDMGPFNYVARTFFGGRLLHGPRVTNTFRSGKPGEHSWWAHK